MSGCESVFLIVVALVVVALVFFIGVGVGRNG